MRFSVRLAAWTALVLFSGIIAFNSAAYFSEPRGHGFVIEKDELADDPIYMAALISHVAAGLTCLAASFLQFFRPLLRCAPGLHRWLGRTYTFSVLAVLTPTGLFLAPHAHGGLAGAVGFIVLGVATFVTTWIGWIEARRKRMREHARWMVRSFAMASSALTFRLLHTSLDSAGIDANASYLSALYFSIFGNALVAELLLFKLPPRSARTATRTRKNHDTIHPLTADARLR